MKRRADKPRVTLPEALVYNAEAEAAALGACLMMDTKAVDIAMQRLRSEQFYFPTYRAVFEAIVQCWQRRQYDDALIYIDPVTVGAAMRANGTWSNSMPGVLTMMVESCPSSANIGRYIDIMQECAQRRALWSLSETVTEALCNGSSPGEVINSARRALDDIERHACIDAKRIFEARK